MWSNQDSSFTLANRGFKWLYLQLKAKRKEKIGLELNDEIRRDVIQMPLD